jgi:hypothetical protein
MRTFSAPPVFSHTGGRGAHHMWFRVPARASARAFDFFVRSRSACDRSDVVRALAAVGEQCRVIRDRGLVVCGVGDREPGHRFGDARCGFQGDAGEFDVERREIGGFALPFDQPRSGLLYGPAVEVDAEIDERAGDAEQEPVDV